MRRLCFVIILVFVMTLSACHKNVADESESTTVSEQPCTFESTNGFEPTDSLESTHGFEPTLTVTETPWTGWTPEQPEPTTNTFEGITEGSVVYDDNVYGKITVVNVTDSIVELKIEYATYEDIVLSTFVETQGSGYSLTADPLETITIPRGKEFEIASQTMDGGVILTFKYE